MENKRDFKGVWVPASIWNSNILSTDEKHLLHEIDSFTSNDHPCFASNEYFSKFLNCSEYTISRMIKNLKKMGLIKQDNFDGRKRYLKSLICEFSEAELRKRLFRVAESARQDCEISNILNTSTNILNNTNKRDRQKNPESTNNLKQREKVFFSSLTNYLDKFDKKLIRNFYDYWTETNKSNSKMRFELEKTWNLNKRLSRWSNNEKMFNNHSKKTIHDQVQDQLNEMKK